MKEIAKQVGRVLFGSEFDSCLEKKLCVNCGRPAHDHCRTEAGHREVEISGICEECFDKMFG